MRASGRKGLFYKETIFAVMHTLLKNAMPHLLGKNSEIQGGSRICRHDTDRLTGSHGLKDLLEF